MSHKTIGVFSIIYRRVFASSGSIYTEISLYESDRVGLIERSVRYRDSNVSSCDNIILFVTRTELAGLLLSEITEQH